MRAVANAGPLIHMSWVGRLDLLQELFEEIIVPPAVRQEVLHAGPHVPGVTALRAAFTTGQLQVEPLQDPGAATTISAGLDPGESEAIALMREVGADVLLLDDRRARATAQRLGLPFTGTVGILRRARDRGLILAVAPVVEELRRRGFRISNELLDELGREESGKGLA